MSRADRRELPDADLPILDLALLEADETAADSFRSNLLQAMHEVGFCYLVGHGIPEEDMAAAFSAAERFFALPEKDKLAVEMTRSAQFRGYTRTGGELTQGHVDWREQIDLGAERPTVGGGPAFLRLEGPNQWPDQLPELRTVFTDWERRCTRIGMRLLHAWAQALGSPADIFDDAFGLEPSTLIKLVRYPGRDDEDRQGVGAHKDPGVLTLLLVEPGKGGLQIEYNGHWIDAPPVPGAFVVNIGELMEFATGGYLKATTHRVLSPPAGASRLSIPFFLNPALDRAMPRLELPADLAAQAHGVTRDPANHISGTFGDNLLKARLRAHPDVAAIHHPDLVDAASNPTAG